MASKIWQWIDERLSFSTMVQSGLKEEIPGGSSFFFTLGSGTLFLFNLQILTGIWQLFYYVPSVDHAYESLSYLRLTVAYGWLIHGLHYWGANAMVVLVGLHMLRVFIWGAYKKPRELTWLLGVFLLLLVVGLVFTGAALPWDERGYWAAEVGTSIAGTVPFIGKMLIYLLRGGEIMGQLALSRFFVLHTVILPGIAFAIIVVHIIAFRKYGSVGPWNEAKRQKKGDFWPDQVAKDIIVGAIILIILVALSVFYPPPFTGPADPLDTSFVPKPEWNFLFLYQTLKDFTGSFEILGTIGVPTLIILLLVFVPFLDRKKERSPMKRPLMMTGGLAFVAFVLTLTITGYNSKPGGSRTRKEVVKTKVKKLSPSALMGQTIYKTYACFTCHKMSGEGGSIGPDLTDELQKGRSKEWIITQITNSKKNFPKSIMPPFTQLSDQQLSQLADFILSPHPQVISSAADTSAPLSKPTSDKAADSNLKEQPQTEKPALALNDTIRTKTEGKKKLGPPGEAAFIIGNVAHGAMLFKRNCESCHGINGKGGTPNPGSLTGKVPALNPISKTLYNENSGIFAANIDRFIQHGSVPAGNNPALKMINYGDSRSLTQQEISHLEAFILNLNGVNRAQIEAPASNTYQFFFITIGIFFAASLILVIIGFFVKKNGK
ncbi:MAG: c-type cytochrome [Chlorobi bacterium]|nr:c-type cytochrome [Chlorobiota bacterium]